MWVLWQYLKKKKGLKKVIFWLVLRKSHLSLLSAHSRVVKMQVLSAWNALKTQQKRCWTQIIPLSSFYHWQNVNGEHSWQHVHNSFVWQTDHQECSKTILLKTTVLHFDSSNAKVFPSLCIERWQKVHFIILNQFQTMETKRTRDCVKKPFQVIVT